MMTSKKAPGFYAGMLACVLAIAAAVCYGVVFPGIEYKEQVFDIRICVILAAAGILAAVLLLAGERTAGFACFRYHLRHRALPPDHPAGGLRRADCRRPGGGRDRALSEKVPARLTGTTRREEELP